MDCAAEESDIRHALRPLGGTVQELQFRLPHRELRFRAEMPVLARVQQAIHAAGYRTTVTPLRDDAPSASAADAPQTCAACTGWEANASTAGADAHAPASAAELPATRRFGEGLKPIVAALVLAAGAEWLHAVLGGTTAGRLAGMAVAVLAIALSGLSTYRKGLAALRKGRLNINALMTVAVTGAFVLGQWPEAAMVMALYALAEWLEARSTARARQAIDQLLRLAPETAQVRQNDGSWATVPARTVATGSVVRTRAGERIALDGVVLQGRGSVNQAPVTGESIPVDKTTGDPVYAGTINLDGVLEWRATAPASQSLLARIIAAVEEAQESRAPTQTFIDRFAALYTPAIFFIALAVTLAGPLLLGWTWWRGIYTGLVLLVIGCPCALVIATPVTVVSALTSAARRGMLFKGGAALEKAGTLRAVAFDKTGTLTHGSPRLVDMGVAAEPGALLPTTELLALAAGLAEASDHPVSRAIAAGLQARQVPPVGIPSDTVRNLPGQGMVGQWQSHSLALGSLRWLQGTSTPAAQALAMAMDHEAAEGRSVTVLAVDGTPQAWFSVADPVRPQAMDAIDALHGLGLHTVMLSGDHAAAVQSVARQTGLEEARGELLPEHKLTAIRDLQQSHGLTAMVGDGINDAPALARADLGFAMGRAGTDIALETADVVVMNDDLRRIPEAIRLSRHMHGLLWQNIAIALGIKLAVLGWALAGHASMWMAVFADMGASLLVVANGLRMLRWKPAESPARN